MQKILGGALSSEESSISSKVGKRLRKSSEFVSSVLIKFSGVKKQKTKQKKHETYKRIS